MSCKTEFAAGALGVQLAARLPVGLGRVPQHAAPIAGERHDPIHQVLDRNLLRRPDVNRSRLVVPLGGQNDGVCRVVDVKELARWRARAPHSDGGLALLARLDAFSDQRGNHV